MKRDRWASTWYQLDEVIRLNPTKVLEIGPGPGVFKQVAALFGLKVDTVDLDPELKPDLVGSALNLPFFDASYDVVCAFQMLEHLPYEVSLNAFQELVRVSRRYVIISLPDARPVWRFCLNVPILGTCSLLFSRPILTNPKHIFDGEHYWEINKKGHSLTRVLSDFGSFCNVLKTYRPFENPYHRFFVCRKNK